MRDFPLTFRLQKMTFSPATNAAESKKLCLGILSLLILGVLLVLGLGLALGEGVLNALAASERAPERVRDNAQLSFSKTIQQNEADTAILTLTLRSGASSGVAAARAGLAETNANREAAHLWLGLDAAARGRPRLADAHRSAATAARTEANAGLRENYAKLMGWASIPAADANALADWNDTVGKGIKE